jgi:hypothetical protein
VTNPTLTNASSVDPHETSLDWGSSRSPFRGHMSKIHRSFFQHAAKARWSASVLDFGFDRFGLRLHVEKRCDANFYACLVDHLAHARARQRPLDIHSVNLVERMGTRRLYNHGACKPSAHIEHFVHMGVQSINPNVCTWTSFVSTCCTLANKPASAHLLRRPSTQTYAPGPHS